MCQINYCLGFGSLRSIHFTIVETQPIASLGILEYYHPKKIKFLQVNKCQPRKSWKKEEIKEN